VPDEDPPPRVARLLRILLNPFGKGEPVTDSPRRIGEILADPKPEMREAKVDWQMNVYANKCAVRTSPPAAREVPGTRRR
jgi:hypothetical protein